MIWSFVLAVIGVTGLYIAGRGSDWGWIIGLATQVLWAVFAIMTDQYGFLVSCLAYGWVYSAPLHRKWRAQREWDRAYEAKLVDARDH